MAKDYEGLPGESIVDLARKLKPDLEGDWPERIREFDRRLLEVVPTGQPISGYSAVAGCDRGGEVVGV